MFASQSRSQPARTPVRYSGKVNAYQIAKLLTVNAGDPGQVIREVLSNSDDAQATYATIIPFPFPSDLAGFVILDDGRGMSCPVEKNANGEDVDAKVRPQVVCFRIQNRAS